MPEGALPYSLEALAKVLVYAGVLTAIGACVFRWCLLPRQDSSPTSSRALSRTAAEVGLAAAGLVVAAQVLRAWAHTAAAFGLADSLAWDNLHLIVVRSRWGGGWMPQFAAGVASLAAFVWARRSRPAAWVLASLAVVAQAATLPMLGHAAGNLVAEAAHAGHILAGGAWLGTLLVVMVVTARVPGADGETDGQRAALLRAFGTVALAGATVLALSGLVAAALHLGAVTNLWTTSYGGALLVKIAIFAGVAACGYTNWRHFRPGDAAAVPRRGIILTELVLAATAILATGVLTELPHP